MRITYIDKLKGLAIILVVMGHVAEKSIGINGQPFNHIYDSFHMPLFMFLSGIFAYKGIRAFSGREALTFLKKKALRVVVPFVVVGGIFAAVATGSPVGLFTAEVGGYWFLPALFMDMIFGLAAIYGVHLLTPPCINSVY